MAKIEGDISVGDIVEELVKRDILLDDLGVELVRKFGGRMLSIEIQVDPDDLVEEARTSVLTEAARDRDDYEPDSVDADVETLAEAITATRNGEYGMAAILFCRACGLAEALPIERALRA
ncbi:hypothetical protein [Sphingomonas beigongshangi]|uniref:hypothetical protein n=1 Tax=Sphingomonas beigongshangi TaxID=2782540 RepID=UPI001AEDAF8B|nr:hypothetical protein [Sphingomonas beigongshangi]